jgi:hypothetical protein
MELLIFATVPEKPASVALNFTLIPSAIVVLVFQAVRLSMPASQNLLIHFRVSKPYQSPWRINLRR